jgi:hypothetical protein
MVGLACVFIGLWVGLGNGLHKEYETPTPVCYSKRSSFSLPLTLSDKYWCWIGSHYFAERLAGLYIWLWIALFSAALYIPLYFWAEGRLSVDKEKWYIFRTSKADVEYAQRRAALRLLL